MTSTLCATRFLGFWVNFVHCNPERPGRRAAVAHRVRYRRDVTIFLIRHAHAGKRSEWDEADHLRPLSERGRRQSISLIDVVGDVVVGRIVSSPFLRCVETVEPLAERFELAVEFSDALAEGADGEEAYALLLELDQQDGVVCSHGDVIPQLLRRLVAAGMDTDGPLIDQKGSTWIIEMRDGRPFRGRYVKPGA